MTDNGHTSQLPGRPGSETEFSGTATHGARPPGTATPEAEPSSPRIDPRLIRLLLALSGWAALGATAVLPGGSLQRWLPVALFVLLGPGTAALYPLQRSVPGSPHPAARHPEARLEAAVVAMALSLALATLVTEALFLAAWFSASRALALLAGITTLAALCPAVPLPWGSTAPAKDPDASKPTDPPKGPAAAAEPESPEPSGWWPA